MSNARELYIKRLNEGYKRIAEIRNSHVTAHDPMFCSWKDRVEQSLRQLYGNDHDYSERFCRLLFWDAQITMGGGPSWSNDDQERFDGDLQIAEQILEDALEELDFAPIQTKKSQPVPSKDKPPTVVINVHNVLSQTSNIQMNQLLAGLDNLGLTPERRSLAEKHAKDFAAEAQGQQRWPILAKSLEALKSLGKSAYEHVAIPLLLEMLKKQTGIND